MTAQLPSIPIEASKWDQALYAFLVEKGNRSGSRRTVESYSRMLWRFFADTTPGRVTPAVVLAYALNRPGSRGDPDDRFQAAVATCWSAQYAASYSAGGT